MKKIMLILIITMVFIPLVLALPPGITESNGNYYYNDELVEFTTNDLGIGASNWVDSSGITRVYYPIGYYASTAPSYQGHNNFDMFEGQVFRVEKTDITTNLVSETSNIGLQVRMSPDSEEVTYSPEFKTYYNDWNTISEGNTEAMNVVASIYSVYEDVDLVALASQNEYLISAKDGIEIDSLIDVESNELPEYETILLASSKDMDDKSSNVVEKGFWGNMLDNFKNLPTKINGLFGGAKEENAEEAEVKSSITDKGIDGTDKSVTQTDYRMLARNSLLSKDGVNYAVKDNLDLIEVDVINVNGVMSWEVDNEGSTTHYSYNEETRDLVWEKDGVVMVQDSSREVVVLDTEVTARYQGGMAAQGVVNSINSDDTFITVLENLGKVKLVSGEGNSIPLAGSYEVKELPDGAPVLVAVKGGEKSSTTSKNFDINDKGTEKSSTPKGTMVTSSKDSAGSGSAAPSCTI